MAAATVKTAQIKVFHQSILSIIITDLKKKRKRADINSITLCSYHVTHVFQSESTLYSCLNVKELLARNKRDI